MVFLHQKVVTIGWEVTNKVNGEWCTQDSVIFDFDKTILYEEVTSIGYQIYQEPRHETEDEFERIFELDSNVMSLRIIF